MLKFLPENTKVNSGQKVYLCAEPSDINTYANRIIEDIRVFIEGAVLFYRDLVDENNEYDEKSAFSEIHEMQLIVVPVTRKFLFTENIARLKEFPYAVKEHIPVLPILMEKDLESDFNRLCGNIQCLDRTEVSESAAAYEKKLSEILKMSLVGDKLAEQIRNDFDGYIFLSYRKADKYIAQDIISRIHENEMMRDFAIWYDDHLIPGEDFDLSIKKAIEKSNLFAMAMTPNMAKRLENGDQNYVMKYEYPMAAEKMSHEENKGYILPIKDGNISNDVMEKEFPGIPESVSIENQNSIDKILKEVLEKYVNVNNKDDARHLYYMGMAYINGVDVEVNRPLGTELLKKSSDAGDEYATLHLGWMYAENWDYEEAVKYYERYVDLLKDTDRYSDILTYGYDNLIWYSYRNKKLVKTLKYAKKAIEIAEQSVEKDEKKANYFLSEFYDMAGQICDDQRNHKKALEYYEKALAIDEKNYSLDKSSRNAKNLAMAYGSVGKLYHHYIHDDREAGEYLIKAQEVIEKAYAEDSDNLDLLKTLSITYTDILLVNAYNNWDISIEYGEKALDLYKKRIEIKDDRENRYAINFAYSILAEGYLTQKKYENALTMSTERIHVFESLKPDIKNNEYYTDLISTYSQRARIFRKIKEYDEEIETYKLIHSIYLENLRDADSEKLFSKMSKVYYELAHLLERKGSDYHEEAKYYMTLYYRIDFKSKINSILYCINEEDYDNAEKMGTECLNGCRKLINETKDANDYVKYMFTNNRLGQLFNSRKDGKRDTKKALEYYAETVNAGSKIKSNGSQYRSLISAAYTNLVSINLENNDFNAAQDYADKYHAVNMKMYKNNPSEVNLLEMKKNLHNMLVIYYNVSRSKEEKNIIKRVKKISSFYTRLISAISDFTDLTGISVQIGKNDNGESVLKYV